MIDLNALTNDQKAQLNQWAGYFSHKPTEAFAHLISCDESVKCYFTGNQKGKNADVAKEMVMTVLGIHPVEKRNIRPHTQVRTLRFASESLPTDKDAEVKNTQYPVFKKWLPPFLIKKDITIRNPVMTLQDIQGGPDIYVEFVSYGQTVQAQAGVQRFRIWIDEHADYTFYEEQLPRLLAAEGDLVITLTPALDMISWEYDRLYMKARKYVRTKAVRERIKQRTGVMPLAHETHPDRPGSIAIIQAATDDNPTFDKKTINEMFDLIDDEDSIDVRRYGLFRQASGTIFKNFSPHVHVIRGDEFFKDGIPESWPKARAVDYHEHNPWACSWAMISPFDEVFVYREYNPDPSKLVNKEIAYNIAAFSDDERYTLNLIDPLAAKKQTNTGLSTIQDFNKFFYDFERENHGTGGYWQSWDTKSTRGREEIKKRLSNSLKCKRPFNNYIQDENGAQRLPTLWFFDTCTEHIRSMRMWRWEQWQSVESLVTKEPKDKPQQKWSHFPMCLEALFKNSGFCVRSSKNKTYKPPTYFQGRAA